MYPALSPGAAGSALPEDDVYASGPAFKGTSVNAAPPDAVPINLLSSAIAATVVQATPPPLVLRPLCEPHVHTRLVGGSVSSKTKARMCQNLLL